MASSGMEFITSLNSSMASSASTYAKSKAGQRAEIQKELDKTDRDISRLTRLLRSPSSRSGVALGSLTQLYSSQSKLSDSLRTNMMNEQEKARKAVEDLRDKNDALAADATTALEGNTANATAITRVGSDFRDVTRFLGEVNALFNQQKLEGNARILAYSILAQRVAGTDAPQRDAILTEIRRATAQYLKDTQPSLRVDDSVDPIKWAQRNVPIIYEGSAFEKRLLIDPAMQRDYLNGAITVTKPNDDFVDELRGLIRSQVMGTSEPGSASAASSIQIAEIDASIADKQASLDKVFSGALVLADDGATINIKAEASEEQKASAKQVLAAIPGGTYQGFSQAVRGMKAQSGSEGSYLESVKSELSALKTRRDAQVTALSKSPHLSTGKMALLDHPILRVAGFREAPPMRLLKRAGRPEQPAVAAAEPAAPVAAAGDETMPEFERTGSPGVYVIPGIVRKLEDRWAKLSDAVSGSPEEDAAFNELKNTVDDIDGFPKDVKSKLGLGYVDIQALVNEDRKGRSYSKDDAPEFEKSMAKLRNIDPALAENVGTVSDLLVGLGVGSEVSDTMNTSEVLAFLNDESVLGEGYEADPSEETLSLQTLGKSGDLFLRALGPGSSEDTETAIEQAANAFKAPLNQDSRYGTYDFTFEGRPDIAVPPAEKAPKDPGKGTEEYLNEDQKMQHDAMTGVNVPLDVAYRDEAFDDEQSAATGEAISAVKKGHPNPWTQQTRPPFPGEPPTWSETSAAAPPPPAVKPAAPVPVPPAVESPPPAAEAEDPTRKELADLIAQPSLTDDQFGRAADLIGASPENEQQALSEELKTKHPRGAPAEPEFTPEEEEMIAAINLSGGGAYENTPPPPPAAAPAPAPVEPPPDAAAAAKLPSPKDQSELDYVDRALIATARAADKVWNLWDNLGIVAPSDKPGIFSGRPSQPVVKSSEAKGAPQAADPAAEVADVTFQPESSDIRVDFEPLDRPRRQVEAAKIILKKFKDAKLSDNMAKAAIINALSESRMDTFLPAGAEGEKSYGLWHFNTASTGLGYGIKRKDLEDPYWMTDKMIEVLGETGGRPKTDDVEKLSGWITTHIENPSGAKTKAKTRPVRYGKEADKIIKEARAELALETTPEV